MPRVPSRLDVLRHVGAAKRLPFQPILPHSFTANAAPMFHYPGPSPRLKASLASARRNAALTRSDAPEGAAIGASTVISIYSGRSTISGEAPNREGMAERLSNTLMLSQS